MRAQGLSIRKVPDKSQGERVVRFDPLTGERKLVNPDTPNDNHESWPLLGVVIEEKIPKTSMMSQSLVAAGRNEGWISVTPDRGEHDYGDRVIKPAGPPENPWATNHVFIHLDTVTIHTLDGDVKFKVTRQPDKYDGGPDSGVGKPTDAVGDPDTSCDWFYLLEKVG